MFLCNAGITGQSGSCPVFGTDQSTSFRSIQQERVFVNFDSPSQCRGNVTSFNFCHYDSTSRCRTCLYGAILVVYRRNASNSNLYDPVAGSITCHAVTCRSFAAWQRWLLKASRFGRMIWLGPASWMLVTSTLSILLGTFAMALRTRDCIRKTHHVVNYVESHSFNQSAISERGISGDYTSLSTQVMSQEFSGPPTPFEYRHEWPLHI